MSSRSVPIATEVWGVEVSIPTTIIRPPRRAEPPGDRV